MDYNDLAMRFPNYEDCLLGVGETHNNVVYVYDKDLMLDKIRQTALCSYKEALSFFSEHINRDYGPRGPVFFSRIDNVVQV